MGGRWNKGQSRTEGGRPHGWGGPDRAKELGAPVMLDGPWLDGPDQGCCGLLELVPDK